MMNRIPQSDELIDGVDSTDPEFVQIEAEHNEDDYQELDFDLVIEPAEEFPESPVDDEKS